MAPTKTAASRSAHRDATCAPRGGDARALSLQLLEESYVPGRITVKHTARNSVRRSDVNQKSKAINWRGRARTLSGRKRETRIFLAGEEEATSCFFEVRTRRPSSKSAVCLECVCAFSFLSYFISLFFPFFCEVPRDRKRTIWNAAGCTAKRALITMTRIARRRPGY